MLILILGSQKEEEDSPALQDTSFHKHLEFNSCIMAYRSATELSLLYHLHKNPCNQTKPDNYHKDLPYC